MHFLRGNRFALLAMLSAAVLLANSAQGAEEYGTLKGQFVLQGDIPPRTLRVMKGDPNAKDTEICAAEDLYDDDLVVDPDTKGIANIFVYMRAAPKIHPDLMSIPDDQKEIVFDQKGCKFIPHCLVIRTGQTVVVKSADNCPHNTRTGVFRNMQHNFTVPANDRKGERLTYSVPELLPVPIKCDIHPWMSAHWLILDHPYATKTDEQGRFTIEKLPAGEHQFRVWHERVGYINIDKNLTVTKNRTDMLTVKVPDGEIALEPIQVPVERLSGKK